MAEQKKGGNLFGAVNALKKAPEEPEEDADERERRKFNADTVCGRIARSKYFEWITLSVIVFNALYLGYDCDYNARWGKPEELYASSLYGFMVFDNLFCIYFTAEVVIRFIGYVDKMTGLSDKPFLFDCFLVFFMILETWVLAVLGPIDALKQVSILRLLRLTRLFRMAKLMRYFPELQLIVKGMAAAVRSVGCAAILLVLVLYVFAIIFTNEYHQGSKPDDDEDILEIEQLFGSLGKSMRHLLIMGTIMDDITACTNAIRTTGNFGMLMVFFVCVLVSAFTLFNMLLGILCEVVEATEQGEKQKEEEEKLDALLMKFFKTMDLDGNGQISRNEFMKMSQSPEIMDSLSKLEIKQREFSKYAELLFTPKGPPKFDEEGFEILPTLSYTDAVNMIMRLRPGQNVNACDFEYFKQSVLNNNKTIDGYLTSLEKLLEEAAGLDEEEEFEAQASPESDVGPDSNERRPSKDSGDRPPAGRARRPSLDNGRGSVPRAKAASKSRTAASIKALARAGGPSVTAAPPVASRWTLIDEASPRSPFSPGGRRGTVPEEEIAKRLTQLAEKRQTLSGNLRVTASPNGGGRIQGYYNMSHTGSTFRTTNTSQSPNFQRNPYQPDYIEDGEFDDAPFSPQQMTFS